MSETYSIDEVVRTSDETVVRRRFDARNLVWLLLAVIVFTLVSFIELGTSGDSNGVPADPWIALASIAVNLGLILVFRDVYRWEKRGAKGTWRAAELVRRHVSATVIFYCVVQYALLVAYARNGGGWIGWTMFFPFLILGFRMLAIEFIVLHAFFAGTSIVVSLWSEPEEVIGVTIGTTVVNSLCLIVELLVARRLRREIVFDWTDRREHAREQMRMREELQYARELQMSMLPESPPDLPWVDLAGVSLPATEVGGDYYDYFVSGDSVALVCGDVAGHGMASGLVLAALRSGFTLLRDSLHDPAAVLRRLHDLVAQTSRRRMIATVAVLLLDRSGRAVLASAGHPPTILRRAGTGAVETLELFAPPLGVKLPVHIPQSRFACAPGDVFVLHSDGVYECRNAAGESYGLERLVEIVARQSAEATATEIRDAIADDVEAFRGTAPQSDDVTIVVARMR